jgi:hypothetical protein
MRLYPLRATAFKGSSLERFLGKPGIFRILIMKITCSLVGNSSCLEFFVLLYCKGVLQLLHHGSGQLACLATLVEDILNKVFLLGTIPNTPSKNPDVRIEGDEIRLTFGLRFLKHLSRDFENLLGIIVAVIRKCTCIL